MNTIVKTKNVMTSQHIPAQLMVRRNINTDYEPEHPDLFSIRIDGEMFLDNGNNTGGLILSEQFDVNRSNYTTAEVCFFIDREKASENYNQVGAYNFFDMLTRDIISERRKLTKWLEGNVYDVIVIAMDSDEVLHEINGVYAFNGIDALVEEWAGEFKLDFVKEEDKTGDAVVSLETLKTGDYSWVTCAKKNRSFQGQLTVGKAYKIHREDKYDEGISYFIIDDNWDVWMLGNPADSLFKPYHPSNS